MTSQKHYSLFKSRQSNTDDHSPDRWIADRTIFATPHLPRKGNAAGKALHSSENNSLQRKRQKILQDIKKCQKHQRKVTHHHKGK